MTSRLINKDQQRVLLNGVIKMDITLRIYYLHYLSEILLKLHCNGVYEKNHNYYLRLLNNVSITQLVLI